MAHTETMQTPSTRSPSTRPARLRCSPRESVVMIVSRAVMVVRPSPSSTRYGQDRSSLETCTNTATEGEDHQEGRAPTRVHSVQGTTCPLSSILTHLTTSRPRHSSPSSDASTSSSVVTRRPRVRLLSSKRVSCSLFCWALGVVFWGG